MLNVEVAIFHDPRVDALARRLGHDRYGTIGRLLHAWGLAEEAGSDWVPDEDMLGFIWDAEPEAVVKALLACKLARRDSSGEYRFSGGARLKWRERFREAGRASGRARRAANCEVESEHNPGSNGKPNDFHHSSDEQRTTLNDVERRWNDAEQRCNETERPGNETEPLYFSFSLQGGGPPSDSDPSLRSGSGGAAAPRASAGEGSRGSENGAQGQLGLEGGSEEGALGSGDEQSWAVAGPPGGAGARQGPGRKRRSPGRSQPRREATPGAREFRAAFGALYEEATGVPPTWEPKQHQLVKRALARTGGDVGAAAARARAMFAAARRGWPEAPDLGTLVSCWDRFPPMGAGAPNAKMTADDLAAQLLADEAAEEGESDGGFIDVDPG